MGKHGRIAALIGLLVFLHTFARGWEKHQHHLDTMLQANNDQKGYHQWLPAVFIDGELNRLPWTTELDYNHLLSMYNYGVALMQAPFFLCAHTYTLVVDGTADGWSRPYAVAQLVGSAFYLASGLALLFLMLVRRFRRNISIITVLALALGTNLHYYACFEPGMSHAISFFLFAIFICCSHRMIDGATWSNVAALGVIAALITLVRPLNAVVALYPLLVGCTSAKQVKERINGLPRNGVALAIFGALVIWFPQLYYWKMITGHWFIFTYGAQGQVFNWSHPHGLDVLFSHQNGWFIYTPLMLPAMIALVVMAIRKVTGARTILFIWLLAWWCYASWWCWWLGAGFGFRGFVEYGVLLALPIAWSLSQAWNLLWLRIALLAFMLLCVHFNLRLSDQYVWPWEGPDWTWHRVHEQYRTAAW